jgi:quercetin dioxygenase-like cupin family protein/lambda repressor-like predicted transcriptional regulator
VGVVNRAGAEGSTEDGPYRLEDEIVAVGKTIRTLRKEKGLSLRELSRLAGLSTSFLSMVERGRSSLALTSLNNVAKALDTDLADLFANERKVRVSHPLPHVSRADEDGRLSIASSQRVYKVLSPRAPGLILEPLLVTIRPDSGREEPYSHEGEEFAYVIEGELIFTVDGEEYRLGPGDSIHVLPTVPHAIRNDTHEPVKVLWVLTPRFI